MNAKYDNAPVGVYDSGLGGLTVWREIRRALPAESLVYLGDGANCPYGSRPREEVRRLADAAVGRLAEAGCKLVVVACNTATAAAIDSLRSGYAPLPIVGMEPAVKPACLATRSGVVGVLATERSLDGELFRRTAAKYGGGIEVLTVPGRGFVELVEGDREDTPEAEACVRAVVEPMLERGADQIVLGCTHYPMLAAAIRKVVGPEVHIVDSAATTAEVVKRRLADKGLAHPQAGRTGRIRFFITDDPQRFTRTGSRFLVYLPITNQLPNVSIQEGKKSGRTGMGSILLVDDELRVVRYFKRRLLHLGYQVDAFTDPEEALNTFKRTPEHWDLLIVDEAMPKLRGTALLQYMKQHNHDLRVILVTGLVGDSAIRLHAERQIDEILTKPVEFEALSGTIVRLLSEETSDK